jgi:hypothetical protein
VFLESDEYQIAAVSLKKKNSYMIVLAVHLLFVDKLDAMHNQL